MKANHNNLTTNTSFTTVVVNISSSKNESKSQPKEENRLQVVRCCKYQ
nr:hypothetical protein [Pedobacter puniceum]